MYECAGYQRLDGCLTALRVLPASFVLLCFLGSTPSLGEGMALEGGNPGQNINLNVENAPIASVLQTLHAKYGIEITGADKLEADDPVTMTISGTLPAILERLLGNRNYMLVRSLSNITGISKILIAGASRGDTAAKPKPMARPFHSDPNLP